MSISDSGNMNRCKFTKDLGVCCCTNPYTLLLLSIKTDGVQSEQDLRVRLYISRGVKSVAFIGLTR